MNWSKPKLVERERTVAEYREILEEIANAASAAYSELYGTTMHRRGHAVIEGLHEPMRKAKCILGGFEYTPAAA